MDIVDLDGDIGTEAAAGRRQTAGAVAGTARAVVRKQQVAVSFSPAVLAAIDARAARRGQSRSGVVNQAVTESLERWERLESEVVR